VRFNEPGGEWLAFTTSILGKSREKRHRKSESSPPAASPICPECASQKIWKDGLRSTQYGDVQRWLCRACGYRFSEPNVKVDIFDQGVETPNPMNKLTESRVRNRDLPIKETFDKLSFSLSENVGPHSKSSANPTVGKSLYLLPSNSRNRQVCETDGASKNLSQQRTRQKQAAGPQRQQSRKAKSLNSHGGLRKKATENTPYSGVHSG